MRAAAALLLLLSATVVPAATVHSSVTTARDGSRTMVQTTMVSAPAREVWDALTTAKGWRRWAAPIAWQVGSRPRLIETSYDQTAHPGGPSTIRQLFISEVPYRSLAFRTIKAPAGFRHLETYRKVINRVELTPLGPKRTRVRFSAGPYPDTPAGRELFGFFQRGNRKTLENMAQVLGGHARNRFAKKR